MALSTTKTVLSQAKARSGIVKLLRCHRKGIFRCSLLVLAIFVKESSWQNLILKFRFVWSFLVEAFAGVLEEVWTEIHGG